MSGFSETIMRERLEKLTNTIHSIQTLSLWLIHHQRKHADVILTTWLKEIEETTVDDPEKLVSLINLANDVIQNCRKKNPKFMKSFLVVLKPGISHIAEVGDDRCRKTVGRILAVWRDRAIYSKQELDELSNCLETMETLTSPFTPIKDDGDERQHEGQSDSPPTTTSPNNSMKLKSEFKSFSKTTTSLVAVLRKLEDPASADANIRQLIASYPENIANPALLNQVKRIGPAEELMEKIKEADPVVNAYCTRLKTELQDRRTAQRLLGEYLSALNEASERNKSLISSVRKKINRIDQEKKEMIKHIESLPDLNEMFGESTGSSLPTLGELFH